MSKRGFLPRTVMAVLAGVVPLVLEGCKFNDQMSGCEKAGLGFLYFLGIVAAAALVGGVTLLAALRP